MYRLFILGERDNYTATHPQKRLRWAIETLLINKCKASWCVGHLSTIGCTWFQDSGVRSLIEELRAKLKGFQEKGKVNTQQF